MPPQDEGIDFSHAMERKTGGLTPIPQKPTKPRFTRNLKIMVGILVVLAIIQIFIIYLGRPPKPGTKSGALPTQTHNL
jgi:hypothetical protein